MLPAGPDHVQVQVQKLRPSCGSRQHPALVTMLFLTGYMTFGESLPLFGQSPLRCPHPTDIFCCQGLGLEKCLRPGTGDPAGIKVGGQTVHSTTLPVVPPYHHPSFHLMGLAQLRKTWDNPAHWDLEVASCLSVPSCSICPYLASPKPDIFPESRGRSPILIRWP